MIRVVYEAFLLTETDRLSGMLPFLCQSERFFENVEPHLSKLVPHLSNVVPLFERLVPLLSTLVQLFERLVPHLSTFVPLFKRLVSHLSNVVQLFENVVPHLSRLVPFSKKQVITVLKSINKTINVLKNSESDWENLINYQVLYLASLICNYNHFGVFYSKFGK